MLSKFFHSAVLFLLQLFVLQLVALPLAADTRMVIHHDDFQLANQYNGLSFFGFEIIFDGELTSGIHDNPPIAYLEYHIVGQLHDPTPSGIEHFHLTRIMDGSEFYAQGSSLQFEIKDSADFSDGIQFDELEDGFTLYGVEIGTGQYHAPLIELHADGTGVIQNADNFGGVNDETGMMVDVDFGEEYIVNLLFDPVNLEITQPFDGDMNRDCQIDLLDVQPFVDALTNGDFDEIADMNGDGADDLLDVVLFVLAVING